MKRSRSRATKNIAGVGRGTLVGVSFFQLGGRSETTGVGFVKEVGFKLGVKERWSYIGVQSGESEEEEVMGEGINE